MDILSVYPSILEAEIKGRYLPSEVILPLLDRYAKQWKIETIGSSVQGESIKMLKIGTGRKKVLAWSQMHGNESTTTKAVLDFLSFLSQKEFFQEEIEVFKSTFTFYLIPILNPDGANRYTRENANGVDLNRDAQNLNQPESKALRKVFSEIIPDLCLNLHDQRSIYGFETGEMASLSFLSPAADPNRNVTDARAVAMAHIEKMAGALQALVPHRIGRYDDAFNPNCVGDAFQMAAVPTILFEAGHFPDDYQREESRKFVWYALMVLFGFVKTTAFKSFSYAAIPENKKNFYDMIIRNVKKPAARNTMSVGLQYREILENNRIQFVPYIEAIGDLSAYFGHKECDAKGSRLLINSQEKYGIGEKVSKIISKNDNSVLYINEN